MPKIAFISSIIFLLILIFIHSFISLGKLLQKSPYKWNNRIFNALAILCISLIIYASFILPYHTNTFFDAVLMSFGSGILFFFILLSLCLIIVDILKWLLNLLDLTYISKYLQKWKAKYLLWFCIGLVLFSFIFHFFTFIHTIPVHLKKDINIKHTKILVVSDIHLGYLNNKTMLTHWVEKINEQNPDFVLILGDLIDRFVKPVRESNLLPIIDQIKAPIYAVLGNHDNIDQKDKVADYLKESKIQLLQDETKIVQDHFLLIGRKDAGFAKKTNRKTLKEIIKNKDLSKYITILMDHQPSKNYKEIIKEYPQLDFILAGHTHGGQVPPLSWINHYAFILNRGEIIQGNTHFIVTQGLGTSDLFPFRLGTKSEMIILEWS